MRFLFNIMSLFTRAAAALRRLLAEGETPVFYAGTAQTLPPPLTKEEETALLQRLAAGDDSVKEELIVRNLRLVVYLARKFESSGVGTDDLISIGTLGLIKAVNTFSPDKHVKLATYASRCIENEILMVLRKGAGRRTQLSLDEPLNVDWEGNELLLSDVLGSDENTVFDNIERADECRRLRVLVDRLPPREREILTLRFGLNGRPALTQKQVASRLGISQSYISRLEKKIMERLKKELVNFL
ncbi:MAG: sigma-70 family RNA polymerase sigma factor [Clostridia bacterium]|nr:sigma-70 family RNA polymerase sigma factor [Clostridia bacterium]